MTKKKAAKTAPKKNAAKAAPKTATPEEKAPLGFIAGTDTPRTRNKVAIMGFAASSMEDVKYVWDDPDMEVWGLNQLYIVFPAIVEKATRWLQIHHKHSYDRNLERDVSHHEWLTKQTKFPIYMMDKVDDVPMSVKWPKDQLLQVFSRKYFTNSISWMIALAIAEAFEEIHIFGVDMAQDDEIDSEYAEQRPSCEYFIGYAEGRGIKVVIPDKSDLLKCLWLYPYEDASPFRSKLEARRGELRGRVNQLAAQEQQARDARMQLMGALENNNHIFRNWAQSVNENVKQNAIQGE